MFFGVLRRGAYIYIWAFLRQALEKKKGEKKWNKFRVMASMRFAITIITALYLGLVAKLIETSK